MRKEIDQTPFYDSLVPFGDYSYYRLQRLKENPDKVIRTWSPKKEVEYHELFEKAQKARGLFNELQIDYKIRVPVDFIIGADEEGNKVIYIITDKIDGDNVFNRIDTFDRRDQEKLKEEVEQLFLSLVQYYRDKYKNHQDFLTDLDHLGQYMFGSKKGEEESHIYLVDTDPFIASDKGSIFMSLQGLAEMIMEMERMLGIKFEKVRQFFIESLKRVSTIDRETYPIRWESIKSKLNLRRGKDVFGHI